MSETKSTTQKWLYFVLGAGVPLGLYFLWSKTCILRQKQHIDHAHDVTVEDSFPASDPPSAW